METSKFTTGCDPEFFLFSKDLDSYVSAIPFVKGTKHNPEPLKSGGYVMRDNVAIEFGMPPANNINQWVKNINKNIRAVKAYIPKHLELKITASTNFDAQQLSHPEAAEIGCAPDFNAWTGEQNIPPNDFAQSTFRSCGGHIHVGFVEGSGYDFLLDPNGKRDMIKMMDCLLGTISLLLDDGEDAKARRKIYGKAGCYRPTNYGVEYRTLSNFWCKTDNLKRLMYRLTADSLENVRDSLVSGLVDTLGGADNVQRIINQGDKEFINDNINRICQFISPESSYNLEEVLNER
jgi:hypothetical protein